MKPTALLLLLLLPASVANAAESLLVRVLDVGAGHCCVIRSSDGRYMIYDAGRAAANADQIQQIIPRGSTIDLLALSHYDSDHIGAIKRICEDFVVKTALHTGMERSGVEWKKAPEAIAAEPGCLDLNLARTNVEFGRVFNIGSAKATFVCGFNQPRPEWPLEDSGESNNAVSIVMRLDYAGKSILLTGDAVGRHRGSADTNSMATEKFMIDNTNRVSIRANVLVAPHHGADNGSSINFIKAVAPKYVVFPAGHDHNHPAQAAVNRYLEAGVWEFAMFRTDFGDCESAKEWDDGNSKGKDLPRDDDIDIEIRANGTISVRYVTPRPRTKVSYKNRPARIPCE